MDTIVNPLKTSVKTVGHAVKHVPDGLRSLSYDGSKSRGVSKSDCHNFSWICYPDIMVLLVIHEPYLIQEFSNMEFTFRYEI